MGFFWTIVVLIITLGLAWRYLGSYMAAVFDGRVHYLAWAERPFYRLLGTSPDKEQAGSATPARPSSSPARSSPSAICC